MWNSRASTKMGWLFGKCDIGSLGKFPSKNKATEIIPNR